ncbi:HEPN-associated N-terminal domain-containing protein [Cellulomonas sp. PSBB021]|uniref:HEPN-associated N-terminal domain-containing protein n=1 Tax=Cellulomonas sp. PSBB021 TaxID=2003551 RepID=UPI0012FE3B8C|nr:HEPN-associated N-terminal domain-containing protein [Cellulomonas sp. PSBB021]
MDLDQWADGSIDGAICLKHITDEYLARSLTPSELTCTLCSASADDGVPIAVPMDDVVEEIRDAINFFYTDAEEVLPYGKDAAELWDAAPDTSDVVDELCGGAFDDLVVERLWGQMVNALGRDRQWTRVWSDAEADDLDHGWEQFSDTVKHESRMVIVTGDASGREGTPARGSASYLSHLLPYVDGDLGLVRTLPAGTTVHRGRLVETANDIAWTAKELGPAPRGRATANRMSPAGVSMFYASGSVDTAVAEIAGHGVKPYALIGAFVSTRPLDVLDLMAVPSYPPVFDKSRRAEVRARSFLGSFKYLVTKPVIPDGRVHVEYVPTQVVTEYLRWAPKRRIDGICIPSEPGDGKPTYVFFFGPEDFIEDTDSSETDRTFLIDIEFQPPGPVFTLKADDVGFYKVERKPKAIRQDARPSP